MELSRSNTTPVVKAATFGTTRPANTTPTVPKLRDSCVACASSKVRCYRQKPSCSKCLVRGIKCEYVRSKRGGRNPATRSKTTTSSGAETTLSTVVALGSPQPPVSPTNWFAQLPPITDTSHTPTTTSLASSRTYSDPLGSSPSTEFPGLECGFDQFIVSASTSNFPGNEKALDMLGDLGDLDSLSMVFNENDMMSWTENLQTSGDAGTPALFSNPQSSVSSASGQLFPSVFTSDILQNDSDSETTSSQCGCLLWAIGLVKQVFTDPSVSSALSSATTTPTHHIRAALSRNKQAIDKIDTILQCYCSHDGYLLVMLSMILLKLMDCYADAAHKYRLALSTAIGWEHIGGTGSSDITKDGNTYKSLGRSRVPSTNSPSGLGEGTFGPGTKGAKSTRSSMNLVLDELHRPQRMVNQLSDMLEAEEPKCSSQETNNAFLLNYSGMGKGGTMVSDLNPTSLFSDVFLKQLGLDLRRRFQKLSLEVREAGRQF